MNAIDIIILVAVGFTLAYGLSLYLRKSRPQSYVPSDYVVSRPAAVDYNLEDEFDNIVEPTQRQLDVNDAKIQEMVMRLCLMTESEREETILQFRTSDSRLAAALESNLNRYQLMTA